MKKHLIPALFCFFCLLSCQEVGPYRDLEISIYNVNHGEISIYQLPDSILAYSTYFEILKDNTIHISNMPDGRYLLVVTSDTLTHQQKFEYDGVIGLGVVF